MLSLCIIFVCIVFFSCGLEEYVYLNPVENTITTGDTSAVIILPSGQHPLFRRYQIFYRIYLTDNISRYTFSNENEMEDINLALRNDYRILRPYTSIDSVSSTTIETVFERRMYYSLFESANGTDTQSVVPILDQASGTLTINFSDTEIPTIIYTPAPPVPNFLFRGNYTSNANRLFLFNTNLTAASLDVQEKIGSATAVAAYVSMYIVASGLDGNYSPIYSRPTHIGIFHLPARNP